MVYTPRGIERIVDEQVKKWQASRRAPLVSERPRPKVIAISRQAGARGHSLARAVAAELGFRCWDQQLLSAMAENGEASETLLAAIDERGRNSVAERIAVFGTHRGPVESYMHELVKLVNTLGEQGSAVIVGRGAQYILGPHRALGVRAVAPVEDRIAMRIERDGLEWSDAKRQLDTIDEARATFLREHFERSGTETETYDMVVNTATLGVLGAAACVVAAYRAKIDRVERTTSPTHAEMGRP